MFELTLSTTIDKQCYIQELFKKLSSEIKRDFGILTKHISGGRISLAIAVNFEKKEYYKSKILDYLLFVIIDDYKYNFYKDNLKVMEENLIYKSFLKAISIFDAEIDKEIIKSELVLSGEILIDSYYYFKLQPLQERWKRTAGIINQNNILSSTNSMIEILKYLTAVSENQLFKADIIVGKSKTHITSFLGEKHYQNDFCGFSDMLTEIVRLNPAKINLKISKNCSNFEKTYDALSKIFVDKIYIQNWKYIDKAKLVDYNLIVTCRTSRLKVLSKREEILGWKFPWCVFNWNHLHFIKLNKNKRGWIFQRNKVEPRLIVVLMLILA